MRVTNRVFPYPAGESPSFQYPEHYDPAERFLLGRLGERPLVAICTNPSAALAIAAMLPSMQSSVLAPNLVSTDSVFPTYIHRGALTHLK